MKLFRHIALLSIAITSVLFGLDHTLAAFSDVSGSSTPYSEAIDSYRSQGIISGYNDGSFKPNATINRAEFMKIVMTARDGELDGPEGFCFPDVGDQWHAPYICTARQDGIVSGYPDGTFQPGEDINFVEAGKIISLVFEQDIEELGFDWYEKYVRALEASKAIPQTIDSLERKITRGEMVEMMWRLTENKKDQPTRGYLNVKYPNMKVDLSKDTPQLASSCEDIRAFRQEGNRSGGRMLYAEDAVAMPMMARSNAMGAVAESAPASKSADFSETNVQVQGVDEADIVKTDGSYLYIIRNQFLSIVSTMPDSDLKVMSQIDLTSAQFNPRELYIDGDRLVMIGDRWEQVQYSQPAVGIFSKMIAPDIGYYGSNRTEVRIYNVADRSNPTLDRTLSFEGNQVSSRKIGDKMYLVMNQGMHWGYPTPLAEARDDQLIPQMRDSAGSNEDVPVARCGTVVILPRVPSPQYLMVAVIPTDSATAPVNVETVIGNGDNVYMSLDNLYVANTQYDYNWYGQNRGSTEKTNIYRFALTDEGIDLSAQGSVPGRILNQFSMDEHENHFRIATTKGNMWDEQNPSTNNVYILNQEMNHVGKIEGIAPGERIYSTRFMGDRLYMVTFKKVDPFFVIDTSNPAQPLILGKLKLPGYSDYLHPYDDDHVIGFGKDTTESKDGNFAWYQGMKIALFDVRDVSKPVVRHEIIIGDRGTESQLLHNHKALLFEKDRDLLAFPIRIHKIPDSQKSNPNGNAWGELEWQGAQVYRLTLEKGFQLQGQISHYTKDDEKKAGSYFYGKDVERILRIDDSLLTISQDGVKKHSFPSIKLEDAIRYDEEESEECNGSEECEGVSDECPDDSEANYVSKIPETCQVLRFTCSEGMTVFSGSCGCGCK